MTLKPVSYVMIGAFLGGVVMTLIGSATVLLSP